MLARFLQEKKDLQIYFFNLDSTPLCPTVQIVRYLAVQLSFGLSSHPSQMTFCFPEKLWKSGKVGENNEYNEALV